MNNFLLATWTLLWREVVRFLRQKHRIIGALGTPLVFWFLIGSGLGRSFRNPLLDNAMNGTGSFGYLEYFFPGTVVLILLFTAIFSTISIIEDRREGFLQAVLVAPVPRSTIVLGKLLGGTVLATVQGMLFLVMAPFLHLPLGLREFAYVFILITVMSFGLTGLGFLIAWKLDSTQGFHAIMNLFLMPLWFLSGSLFPMEGAPVWLRWVMAANPLTYSVSGLQRGLFHLMDSSSIGPHNSLFCLGITCLFAFLMFVLSVQVAARVPKPSK